MNLADHEHVRQIIALARAEDLGSGDITAALLDDEDPGRSANAENALVSREAGILAGTEIAPAILHAYDVGLSIQWQSGIFDGARFERGQPLGIVRGPKPALLSAERVLLNFLQRLCGIATKTRQFVDAVTDTGAGIYDTRKTTPGLRILEKYAVRCGGGRNHRFGLFDAVLIKDNHIAHVPKARLAATLFHMLNQIPKDRPVPDFVEVEVDSLDQLEQVLDVVGVDIVLLDNFELQQLKEAVAIRDGRGLKGKVSLEASGGVTLESVARIARTGVERISVGAITHSARAIDLSLEAIPTS